MKKLYTIIIAITLLAVTNSVYAAGYGKQVITSKQIRTGTTEILIVPGHEPDFGGTVFGKHKERDIVLMIADELEELLEDEKNIKVFRTRDEDGWTKTFSTYFKKEWDAIAKWVDDHKQDAIALLESGEVVESEGVQHNDAAPDTALRLYGINRWSNEKNMDIVIHLHINDIARPDTSVPGDYRGFSIYVPEEQYSNSKASIELGESLKKSLKKVLKVSNLPQENKGVVESQQLIAIGSYNTSDAASVLIEYGYIYEPQFKSKRSQHAFARKVAKQTFLGLQDFLGKK